MVLPTKRLPSLPAGQFLRVRGYIPYINILTRFRTLITRVLFLLDVWRLGSPVFRYFHTIQQPV